MIPTQDEVNASEEGESGDFVGPDEEVKCGTFLTDAMLPAQAMDIAALEQELTRDRLARFERECPHAAREYFAARIELDALVGSFQKMIENDDERYALQCAESVRRDCYHVAIRWLHARTAYRRWFERDLGPVRVALKRNTEGR